MKVYEVMTIDAGFCSSDDNLTKAAEIMRRKDCGIVPVTDAKNKIVGVITDRDICLAAAKIGKKTADIKAHELSLRFVKTCAPDDDVKDVLRRMRKYKIKRLCVAGQEKELLGVISLSDILLKAGDKKSVRKLIFSTLSAIAKPAPIVLKELDAAKIN